MQILFCDDKFLFYALICADAVGGIAEVLKFVLCSVESRESESEGKRPAEIKHDLRLGIECFGLENCNVIVSDDVAVDVDIGVIESDLFAVLVVGDNDPAVVILNLSVVFHVLSPKNKITPESLHFPLNIIKFIK